MRIDRYEVHLHLEDEARPLPDHPAGDHLLHELHLGPRPHPVRRIPLRPEDVGIERRQLLRYVHRHHG